MPTGYRASVSGPVLEALDFLAPLTSIPSVLGSPAVVGLLGYLRQSSPAFLDPLFLQAVVRQGGAADRARIVGPRLGEGNRSGSVGSPHRYSPKRSFNVTRLSHGSVHHPRAHKRENPNMDFRRLKWTAEIA